MLKADRVFLSEKVLNIYQAAGSAVFPESKVKREREGLLPVLLISKFKKYYIRTKNIKAVSYSELKQYFVSENLKEYAEIIEAKEKINRCKSTFISGPF